MTQRKVQSPIERERARLAAMTSEGQTPQDQVPPPEGAPPAAAIVQQPAQEGVKEPAPAVAAPPATPPTDTVSQQLEELTKKHLALQGMHKGYLRQIEELKQALAQEKVKSQGLEAELTVLKSSAPTISPELLATLEREMGRDTVAGIQTLVTSQVQQAQQATEVQIKNAQQKSEAETLAAKREIFAERLEGRVKGWKPIYESEAFQGWMEENAEPVSGMNYGQIMRKAILDWDLERMVVIFNLYKEAAGKTTPVTTQDPREDLVTPGTGGGSGDAAPASTGPKIFSAAEVDKFYSDARKGLIPIDQFNATNREIMLANAEGRIR